MNPILTETHVPHTYQNFIVSNTLPNVVDTFFLAVVDGEALRETANFEQEVRKHLLTIHR